MTNTIEEIKRKIIPVLKKNKIKKAGIFGSYVRGEEKKRSDIDILVELDRKWDLLDIIGLKIKLEKILRKKVDLVEYETIRPELKENILNEEVSIGL